MMRMSIFKAAAPRLFLSCTYIIIRQSSAHCLSFVSNSALGFKNHLTRDLESTFCSARKMDTDLYDFAVIGGGPGGLAAAKEAARYGARTIVFDYVKPSPKGTTWGLGGTCVNVGCIPKKLMHYAAILGKAEHDRTMYGWNSEDHKHDWNKLVTTVQNYIRMLNFSYRSGLMTAGVKYVNAFATLKPDKTIEYTNNDQTTIVRAKHVLIAVGDRPYIPEDVEGAMECAITSDDLFKLSKTPGKTLVIGGSYVALECAGFLTGLSHDVTVSVRSILLRGFDRQCAEKVGQLMEATGTKFLYGILPKSMKKNNDQVEVTFSDGTVELYDTVLYGIGRIPLDTIKEYESIGIKICNGRIIAPNEETSVPGIYAVGDILYNRPALAPVAIKAGELLARRLFNNSTQEMNYENIPICVYTPFEYASCGLSEERAKELYGDGLDVYLKEFNTLELAAAHRTKDKKAQKDEYDTDFPPTCLSKLICLKSGKVVGAHFVGPNAGEIMQGIALAMRLGVTKNDFDNTLSIHPTDAESFMGITVTRESGESWVATGGCGGGRCG